MKFTALLVFMMCASAFAEVPSIRASKVTCQELKDTVEKYGAVIVKKKILLFTTSKYVSHKANCSTDQYSRSYSFKTKDVRDCVVGEWCENPYVYTESSTYSGSGWSGNDYSTPSYDNSTPSSDRGPRYDPPSRDYEGPRYDPPSRDDNDRERGPRYCPNC